MEQPREMNLFDLCAAIGRSIGRGIKGLCHLFGNMLQLTIRQWWIVLIVVSLAVAAALYISRKENRVYEVNGVVMLNGVAKDVVARDYKALGKSNDAFAQQNLASMLQLDYSQIAGCSYFETYDLIDFLADGVVDIIDYDIEVPYDTMSVHMPDMLALQFRTKQPNNVALMQEAILNYLNTRDNIRAPYEQFRADLQREAQFHHDQLEKLDSLTSVFYFSSQTSAQVKLDRKHEELLVGTRAMKLFLEDIQDEMKVLRTTDARLAYASAPVAIVSPFVLENKAINGPFKCVVILVILGWVLGVALAALVENRKQIGRWLTRK